MVEYYVKPKQKGVSYSCYNKESITAEDKFARKCSQWCVNSGFIITCLELVKILPQNEQRDGKALLDRIRSIDMKNLIDAYRQLQNVRYNESIRNVGSFKRFIEMREGDIVILQTRGGSAGNAPPRTLSFGVIQDESLDLFYKEEVIKQHGFPWNFIATKDKKGEPPRLGIMARKVKWYRQGELAKIRGDTQVRWMTEADPHFFAEIGKRNQADLEKALHVMSSDEFLENTHAINNNWIMD